MNSWNVQLEQDATTFTNEAVKVCVRTNAGEKKGSHLGVITDDLSLLDYLDISGRYVWSSSCCLVGAMRST